MQNDSSSTVIRRQTRFLLDTHSVQIMVRKVGKLLPNSRSIEEIVVDRIASNAASATNDPTRQPSISSQRMQRSSSTLSMRSTVRDAPAKTAPASVTRDRTQGQEARATRKQSHEAPRAEIPHRASTTGLNHERRAHHVQIEEYLNESMQEIYAAHGHPKRTKATERGRSATLKKLESNTSAGTHITHTVRDLRSTVRRLDKVFYDVAPEDKRRHAAATKIAIFYRCLLIRRRYELCQTALGAWRARKCEFFLSHMKQFSRREEVIRMTISTMHRLRTHDLLRRVIGELRDLTLTNLPLRRRQKEETEKCFRQKQIMLLKMVVNAWKSSAFGRRSRKAVAADVRSRRQKAKQRLEALGRFDIITPEMIDDEFVRENIRIVRSRHDYHLSRVYFRLLVNLIYLPAKRNAQVAKHHLRRKLLQMVMDAWLPYFQSSQAERAVARRKSTEKRTLEKFDRRFNLRKIDAHYRFANMRRHLRAWHHYCAQLRRVRKLFEGSTRETSKMLVRRWRVRAKYQRALREHAVEQWRGYCRRVFQTPFRAWYNYTSDKKQARNARKHLCEAYTKRQRRHMKYQFFRLWKHQILFGHVEGIHSQLQLLQSLEDQKRMCLGLEANALLYQEKISKLEGSIEQLETKLEEKQKELDGFHDRTKETRVRLHETEEGLGRMHGLVEAVRQVHPGTVTRIERFFQKNPLLSMDLGKLVEVHERKRREVLEKLDLDELELQVQAASSVSEDMKEQRREDQLMLHRVKWVLSRLDLGSYRQQTDRRDLWSSETAPLSTVHQLCALFEFIRDASTDGLTVVNRPAIAFEGRGDDNYLSNQQSVRLEDALESADSWKDFLHGISLTFTPERLMSLKERLLRRAVEMKDETKQLKANAHLHNIYSGNKVHK